MSKRPLQTKQEKVLYLMSLLGTDNALNILETEVKERCNENSNNINKVVKLKRVK